MYSTSACMSIHVYPSKSSCKDAHSTELNKMAALREVLPSWVSFRQLLFLHNTMHPQPPTCVQGWVGLAPVEVVEVWGVEWVGALANVKEWP